ncbi:helix-turn-helix domain-containing protein [Parabacteroides sp. APC149_11_2_Y6]
MQLFKTIDRACQIHALIQKEATGTPDEFAKRLHISRRLLYYLLDELKDVGAEIEYNRRKSTFYYANDFEFNFIIKALDLKCDENNYIVQNNNKHFQK